RNHAGQESSRPLSPDYELVGLRAEQALCLAFNKPEAEVLRCTGLGGDGHREFSCDFYDRAGKIRTFYLYAKCARFPKYLLVQEGYVFRDTIYILGRLIDLE